VDGCDALAAAAPAIAPIASPPTAAAAAPQFQQLAAGYAPVT
jgi:hypothetical protein